MSTNTPVQLSSNEREIPEATYEPPPVRHEWLRQKNVFETVAKDEFRELIRLADRHFDKSAAITILDESLQHTFSGDTPEFSSIDRDESICQYTAHKEEVLVIPDIDDAGEIRQLHSVNRANIGSYAGAPLKLDASKTLGSFCLIDSEAHDYTADEVEDLEMFRNQAVSLLEQHLQEYDLSEAISMLDSSRTFFGIVT